MVNFTLLPQQAALRELAATFASSVLAGAPSTYENYGNQFERFCATRPFYRQAVASGIVKRLVPSNLGGTGGSLLDTIILVEELYAVEASVSLSIISTMLGLGPLIAGGSAEQKEEFLKPFLNGEGEPLASLVLSEPAGSANWLEKGGSGLHTVAWEDRETGDWVIDGEKVRSTIRMCGIYRLIMTDVGYQLLRLGWSGSRYPMRRLSARPGSEKQRPRSIG